MKTIKTIISLAAISMSAIAFSASSPTIIERKQVGSNGGYTIWSDGFIEQWGVKQKNVDQVVFHIPYTDANTISFVIQEYAIGDQYARQPKNLPQTTGVYDFNRSDLVGQWTSKGY